ncbi:MAG TPA: hypothetical protein VEX41_02440 [Candidatus Eisenbacteria bacterium]|nr:hypothetical protein [Candidatus Eisenbacteria bacterium]
MEMPFDGAVPRLLGRSRGGVLGGLDAFAPFGLALDGPIGVDEGPCGVVARQALQVGNAAAGEDRSSRRYGRQAIDRRPPGGLFRCLGTGRVR